MEKVVCYCGVTFSDSQARGRHLRSCPVYKKFSPQEKAEHKERVKILSLARSHNPERGRWTHVMRELLNPEAFLESRD